MSIRPYTRTGIRISLRVRAVLKGSGNESVADGPIEKSLPRKHSWVVSAVDAQDCVEDQPLINLKVVRAMTW